MRKKTLEYLRSLNNKNGINYEMITNKICQQINIFDKRKTGSLYLTKYIASNEYISYRISNHFPTLENYLKIAPGRMSATKQNGHICALFFGSSEANKLKGPERNQYIMGDSKRKHRLRVFDKAFAYYKSNTDITVPYKIYHFIPDLMSSDDVTLLTDSINTWYEHDGDEPFVIPQALSQNVFFKEKSEKGISSIDCKMHIIKAAVNESVNVGVTSGRRPIMTIDMGSVTIVSPDEEELTLLGVLDVMRCNSRDLALLQEITGSDTEQNAGSEDTDAGDTDDFDFDAALRDRNRTQDARQDDNDDAGPVRKHFDEQLETIRSRHPELYESIIIEIEAVISKYFG